MYHGWKVVACAFLIAVFGWGFGFYGIGVFLAELVERHAWATSSVASAVTVLYLAGAVLIAFIGHAFERFGPCQVVLAGMLAMGSAAIALTWITQPWQLYVVFLLMAVGWAPMSGAALNVIIAPWFERRRGLAISIAFNGAAVGGILLVPALVFLMGWIGFKTAVLSLVIVMVGVLTPLVLWLLARCPESLGLAPDGDAPAPRTSRKAEGEGAPRRRDFMRTWHFWSVALPFALGLTAQISVIIHQVSFLRPALGTAGAAWAVSLTSVCAVLGRLGVGLFVDRVNRRAVIAGNFLLQATSIVLMLSGPRPALLYVACAMFGLGVGNTTSLPSVIVQAEFPRAAFGQVVSTITAVNQFTYSFGPGLLGWLRDGFGSYDAAFAGCLLLQLAAVAILLLGGSRSRSRQGRSAVSADRFAPPARAPLRSGCDDPRSASRRRPWASSGAAHDS
jgi:MFS family permease